MNSMTPEELLDLLESGEGDDEELAAWIVAHQHNAIVKPYPPSDDYGPKDKWQFWSEDGKHFLASSGKWKVPPYITSLDAAVSLVPEGWVWDVTSTGQAWIMPEDHESRQIIAHAPTPALALCAAIVRREIQTRKDGDAQ